MPDQPPQDNPYGHDGTGPAPTDPPTTTAPQTGTQGRDRWADGHAAAKRFYGDSAPIALCRIRARLDQFHDEHPKVQHMPMLRNLFNDLQAILDTAQEPR